MVVRRIQIILSTLFFAGWFILLLLAADFPLPSIFWADSVVVALGAVAVYIRIPAYASWPKRKNIVNILRAGFEGAVAGLLIGLLTSRPDTIMQVFPYRYIIGWLAVVISVGTANAALIYIITKILRRS